MSKDNPYGIRSKTETAKKLAEKKKAYESLNPDFLPQKTAAVQPRNPFEGLSIPK